MIGEDFLDNHVGSVRPLGHLCQIRAWAQQSVDVVDPETLQAPLVHQPENQTVDGVEYIVPLHAQGSQVVDVEEATVVDVSARLAPMSEPVALDTEKAAKTPLHAGGSGIETANGGGDGAGHGGVPARRVGQGPFQILAFVSKQGGQRFVRR